MGVRVTLLSCTPDPEGVVARAAKLCYSPLGIADLTREQDAGGRAKLLAKVISLGHHSVLEHASFTFGIEGVSRVMTHQLVRHRIASFSQQSQRYVEFKAGLPVVTPESVERNPAMREKFASHCVKAQELYREMIDAGVPAEDARYALPSAAETRIIVTMNARELRHFFTLRCCERAQWEIRRAAELMLDLAQKSAPGLFTGAGPSCLAGPCPEGKLTCGKIKDVREKYGVRNPIGAPEKTD